MKVPNNHITNFASVQKLEKMQLSVDRAEEDHKSSQGSLFKQNNAQKRSMSPKSKLYKMMTFDLNPIMIS